jgi:two-component system sensor histidine kinase YesM
MMTALSQIRPIDQRTNYIQYTYQSVIRKALVSYSNTSSFVDSFFLYTSKGETFFSSLNRYFILNKITKDQCSLLKAYHQAADAKWIVYTGRERGDLDTHSFITTFQPIYDFNTDEQLGVYAININTQSVVNEISTHMPEKDMHIVISDALGSYIVAPTDSAMSEFFTNKSGAGHEIVNVDSGDYLITYATSGYTGWTLYAILPLSTVLSSTTYVNNIVFWVYLFILISFFGTVFIGKMYFFTPISSIFHAMRQVESGDLSVQVGSKRDDEVGYIINRFNQTLSRLNKLIHENYINKLHLREAQLINVYSQIDEHFLYNTLDSLRWSASYCDPEKISQTVMMLSKYYRLCLSDGKDTVTVREAIEQVEAYLQINKFRLQDRLQYTINVDDEALDFLILKYILQPLVENCVVHGISQDMPNGHIAIRVKYRQDVLEFTISDNGAGIEPLKLQDINATIENNTKKTKYFALHTINLLLKTFYSEKYRLHIKSVKGAGTTYWFKIPLQSNLEDPQPCIK